MGMHSCGVHVEGRGQPWLVGRCLQSCGGRGSSLWAAACATELVCGSPGLYPLSTFHVVEVLGLQTCSGPAFMWVLGITYMPQDPSLCESLGLQTYSRPVCMWVLGSQIQVLTLAVISLPTEPSFQIPILVLLLPLPPHCWNYGCLLHSWLMWFWGSSPGSRAS